MKRSESFLYFFHPSCLLSAQQSVLFVYSCGLNFFVVVVAFYLFTFLFSALLSWFRIVSQ